jgi:putative ABC transport system substrate-binding protein
VNRRQFIPLLGGAAAWPLAARAQQSDRMRRVGVLINEPWPPLDSLKEGLQRLGYIEGKNLQFEFRFAEGHAERYPTLADDLVSLQVDVIVSSATPASLAAKNATSTIPIIMHSGNPIEAGIVSNFARPEGNVTGFSTQTAVEGKRLELLKEFGVRIARVAVLSNATNPYCVLAAENARVAATVLGLQLDIIGISTEDELDAAFRKLNASPPDAVLVIADPFLLSQRRRIGVHMMRNHLPSIYSYRDHVVAGGLVSYSTDFHDVFRRIAAVVDKIFKGAKPSDLPIEQPTKFELVINLKTAKALGLDVPPTMLALADEVIE